MSKTVSVILPVRNEWRYITGCLDSIAAQDYPSDSLEVIVVDGMSEDGTRGLLEEARAKYPNIRVLDNPGRIVPKGLNTGIRAAKGEIIARMDAHAKYAKDYISRCVECLLESGAENVGGVVSYAGNGYVGNSIALAGGFLFGMGGAAFRTANSKRYADTVFPGCWKRQVFDKYGYFDERLARNQDIEFNARIRRSGGKIFINPEIKFYYYCRSSLWALWKQNYANGQWVIYTKAIAPYALSWRHFAPLIFVGALMPSGLLTFDLLGASSLIPRWLTRWIFMLTAGSYLFTNLAVSAGVALRKGLKFLATMPIVFFILHFSYGFGSLWGLLTLPGWYWRKGRKTTLH